MDSRSAFGERLRALRLARGISQEKLCAMLKVNRNFVSAVERGKQNICLDNILGLARALKVNPADLFALYKKQKSSPSKAAETTTSKAT